MRLHHRLSALALAAFAFSLISCETLSGSGKSGPEFIQFRQQLSESRSELERAADTGDLRRLREALASLSRQFDAMQAKSSAMNLLDRQHLAIELASARRILSEASRWVEFEKMEEAREQVRALDTFLGEIDTILERTVLSSTPNTTGGS